VLARNHSDASFQWRQERRERVCGRVYLAALDAGDLALVDAGDGGELPLGELAGAALP